MPPQTPKRRHFGLLNGYRAFAALLIVLTHSALFSGVNGRLDTSLGPYLARADVGVAIFFLLSGFLIYRPFVAARLAQRPGLGTGEYLKRRAIRIIPAYWVALTVIAFVLQAPEFSKPHKAIYHYLLIHVYDIDQVVGGPIQQSWTLATEISFYAMVPLYAAVMGIRRSRRSDRGHFRLELVMAGLLIGGSVALKLVCLWIGISDPRFGQLGTTLPFRLDAFGLGIGMAVISAWHDHTGTNGPRWLHARWFAPACFTAAAVAFWAVATQFGLPLNPIFSSKQAFVVNEFYPLTAFFLLLPAVFGNERQGVIRRAFAHPISHWLGLISYGIYIWHEAFLLKWFHWTGNIELRSPFWQVLGWNLLLTIPVAALSYYLVERPFLRLKRRRA